MALVYLAASPLKTLVFPAPPLSSPSKSVTFLAPPLFSPSRPSIGRSSSRISFQRLEPPRLVMSVKRQRRSMKKLQTMPMAPVEEKFTRCNPLAFHIEWETPKPWKRPDIFPKFSPLKTPLPPPMPYDPPIEDEEKEEKKEEEREDDPEKEDEDQPDIALVRNLSGSSLASNRLAA